MQLRFGTAPGSPQKIGYARYVGISRTDQFNASCQIQGALHPLVNLLDLGLASPPEIRGVEARDVAHGLRVLFPFVL